MICCYAFVGCYDQLGVEDGTVSNGQLSASAYADSNHRPSDGRLNGPTGWVTNSVEGRFCSNNSNVRATISCLAIGSNSNAKLKKMNFSNKVSYLITVAEINQNMLATFTIFRLRQQTQFFL